MTCLMGSRARRASLIPSVSATVAPEAKVQASRLGANVLSSGALKHIGAIVMSPGCMLVPPVPLPLLLLAVPTIAHAQSVSIDLGAAGQAGATARIVQLTALVTVLSLAPSLLVMTTAFTRIVIVLSLLRSALGTQGGGHVAVDPSDREGRKTLQKYFQVDIELPVEDRRLHVGGRAYLRFDHGWEPLGFQWYRRARQLFLSRLNV